MMGEKRGISTGADMDIVYALAASPEFRADGLCFAARSSGLYRSLDGGDTWLDAYLSLDLPEALPTLAVGFSPDFASDGTVFAGVPGAVMHSTDGGETWHASLLRDPQPLISDLGISPNFRKDGTLFAGTYEDGVFNSRDRGGRFVAWNFGLLDLNVLCLAVSPSYTDDETLFAGTESGVFCSTNGARAWREVDFPIDLAPVISLCMQPNYRNGGLLLAGTEAHGLQRSLDSGNSWEPLGDFTASGPVNKILCAGEDGLLVLSGSDLYITRDGGSTWLELERMPASQDADISTCLAPGGLGAGQVLLVGLTSGEIHKTTLS